MKPRLNDQLFARCTSQDRKKVERAARLEGMRPSEFIRSATVNLAIEVLDTAENVKKASV